MLLKESTSMDNIDYKRTRATFPLVLFLVLLGKSSPTDICLRVPDDTTNCLMSSQVDANPSSICLRCSECGKNHHICTVCTVKAALSSKTSEAKKWLLTRGGCLTQFHPVPQNSLTKSCLQELLWDFASYQNISSTNADYFRNVSRRLRRNMSDSSTNFRQRREYRQLSDTERERLHRSLQILYDEGTIHRYGKLFGFAYSNVRNSPAFLSFQRIFLLAFEEELRRVDSEISLPYWDFTIDAQMDNPVNSLLWSSKHFGNGNGRVVLGDFRGWRTPTGPLQRRYGESNYGKLMNRDVIRNIVSKCKSKDINYPVMSEDDEVSVLEYHFNGALNWLGGSAADASTVAYDPVFYFVSAFTDFIWEVFRKNQQINCNTDSTLDYPNNINGQNKGASDTMIGFSDLTYIDGYSNKWTKVWYNYTLAQNCENCNSEFFWCDSYRNRCVSHSRRTDYNILTAVFLTNDSFEPDTKYIPRKVEIPILPSPLNDGRTMASARLDAKTYIAHRKLSLRNRRRNRHVLSTLGKLSVLADSLGRND